MRERIYSDGMMNKQTISNVFLCVIALPLSGTLKGTKSAWDFLGVNFWSRDFFVFCWKP